VDAHAEFPNPADFTIEDGGGQAVGGDAVAQQSARLRGRFKDLSLMAQTGEKPGGGESGRP
jgi:hypothetical protein